MSKNRISNGKDRTLQTCIRNGSSIYESPYSQSIGVGTMLPTNSYHRNEQIHQNEQTTNGAGSGMGMDRYRFSMSEEEHREVTAAISLLDFMATRNFDDQNQLIQSLYQRSTGVLRSLRRGLVFIDTLHVPGAITQISTLIIQEPTVEFGTEGTQRSDEAGHRTRIIAELSYWFHDSQEENLDVSIAITLLDSIIAMRNEERIIRNSNNAAASTWSVRRDDVVHIDGFIPPIPFDDVALDATGSTAGFSPGEMDEIPEVEIDGGPVEFEGQRTCSICMEDFVVKEKVRELKLCRHRFHENCLWPWLRVHRTCPFCRRLH